MLSRVLPNEYSEKEKAMLSQFGINLELMADSCGVHSIYRMAAERAFIEDRSGPATESLRRCMDAFNKCKIYRMTPEWEALIQL